MSKKVKIAFCSQDREYRERFMRCFLHHYKSMYDLYMFDTTAEIANGETYNILIVDGSKDQVIEMAECGRVLILYDSREQISEENLEGFIYEPKYQEVYKIRNTIQKVLSCGGVFTNSSSACRITGVFSLGCENQQIPFCALLAAESGEQKKTLVINLQPYSRFEGTEAEECFSLEDILLSTESENYSRGRLAGAIGHEEHWDFVYSAKNTECLIEANERMYRNVFKVLTQEFGYEHIIINFGVVFSGIHTLMSSCDDFFYLTRKLEEKETREEQYLIELSQKGYEVFTEKICRIEVPRIAGISQDWHHLVEQWRWGILGDQVRKHIWRE